MDGKTQSEFESDERGFLSNLLDRQFDPITGMGSRKIQEGWLGGGIGIQKYFR